jgi:hypothetical protein
LEGGRVLDATTYLATWQLFEGCAKEDDLLAAVRALVPDYGREEFLLPVDAAGSVYPRRACCSFMPAAGTASGLAGWLPRETLDERPCCWRRAGSATWRAAHRAVLIVLVIPAAPTWC